MTLAENAGLDVWLCEFCDQRVNLTDDFITGLDGMHAHRACVEEFRVVNNIPAANRESAANRLDARTDRIEWTHAWLIAHLSNGL